jgi:hypothetical protein
LQKLKNFLLLTFILSSSLVFGKTQVIVAPIYGYEKYYRVTPSPAKFTTRTIFGARATYGVRYLSAELEATTGNKTEVISATIYENKREQARLGLRSIYGAKMINMYIRGGARARRDTDTVTTSAGVKTITEGDIEFDPYIGTGLRLVLGSNFSLNAGATVTVIEDSDGNDDYEIQTTISGSFGIGSF